MERPERVIIPYLGQRRTEETALVSRRRGEGRERERAKFSFRRAIKKKKNKIKFHASAERGKSVKVRVATAQPRSKDLKTWLYVSTSSDQLRYRSLV